MELINGKYVMTKKDLLESLEGEPDDAIIIAGTGPAHSVVYKTACAADDSVIFLYTYEVPSINALLEGRASNASSNEKGSSHHGNN